MVTCTPIDPGVPIQASLSDLVGFQWRYNGIWADFELPSDQEHLLRVSFDRECIVRLLDEMPLSTEDEKQGLVNEHFAYRVEGATFSQTQSDAWKFVNAPVHHYLFVTGWGCMDVLSPAAPMFRVIMRE